VRLIHVVGARPNFMKAAPVLRALRVYSHINQQLVHTGQHYDANMSDVFFQQLDLPQPDYNLEVGSSSHAVQTALIMMRFEEVVLQERPNLVLVYGDVNSTVAAALVCAKLQIPVGHVEAGLRSFDRTMPEEINRLLTDQIAELLFTPSQDGNENLRREGVAPAKIHFVGNVMIDTLVKLLPSMDGRCRQELGLQPQAYALVTMHRPSNVDDRERFTALLQALEIISQELVCVFPVHPRTRARLQEWGVSIPDPSRLRLLNPLGYVDFISLMREARMVITDSGGIQEETTFLGIPCLTLRANTERPVTVTLGTNTLLGDNPERLVAAAASILAGKGKKGTVPPLWDGQASERIAAIIQRIYS
jgi:UDP-N-acetylglucosamine 2-epimerase (non-hydrolysing)